MRLPSRFSSRMAALGTAIFLVGAATAQEIKPAAPAAVPSINKLTIYDGPVATVSYSVQNGSPRLQALAQTLQFTENELSVTGELQKLRLGMVINERTLDAVRTSQALGFGPLSTPSYAACFGAPESGLKQALIPQLAQAATPAMAFQLINLREQVQTELLAEQQKANTPGTVEQSATQKVPPVPPVAALPQLAPSPQLVLGSTPAVVPQPQMSLHSDLQQQVLAFQEQVRQRIKDVQQRQAQQIQMMRNPR